MFRFRIPFALFIFCLFHASAQAQTETILHNFGYFPQGAAPCGTVLRDSAGELYGTTLQGGATNNGVVFERSAAGTYKVLYSFQGGTGRRPAQRRSDGRRGRAIFTARPRPGVHLQPRRRSTS